MLSITPLSVARSTSESIASRACKSSTASVWGFMTSSGRVPVSVGVERAWTTLAWPAIGYWACVAGFEVGCARPVIIAVAGSP